MPYTFNPFTGTLDAVGIPAGAGGDPLPQYLLLAGRPGGQLANGGVAVAENLTLQSTAHATKGLLQWDDSQLWWPSIPDPPPTVTTTQDLARFNATLTMAPSGTHNHILNVLRVDPAITATPAFIFDNDYVTGLELSPTVAVGNNLVFTGIHGGGTYNTTTNNFFGSWRMFQASPLLTSASVNNPPFSALVYESAPIMEYTTTGTGNLTSDVAVDFFSHPTFRNTGAGTLNVSNHVGFKSVPIFTASAGAITVPVLFRMLIQPPSVTGATTITSDIGIAISDLAISATGTASGIVSSISPTNATHRFLVDTGGAPSQFIGQLQRSYTPKSQTVPTGYGVSFVKRQVWTGTQRMTLEGDARLCGH